MATRQVTETTPALNRASGLNIQVRIIRGQPRVVCAANVTRDDNLAQRHHAEEMDYVDMSADTQQKVTDFIQAVFAEWVSRF